MNSGTSAFITLLLLRQAVELLYLHFIFPNSHSDYAGDCGGQRLTSREQEQPLRLFW